jgi:hypothetical protein
MVRAPRENGGSKHDVEDELPSEDRYDEDSDADDIPENEDDE